MRTGATQDAKALLTVDEKYMTQFALNDYALASTGIAKDYEFLATLFVLRVAEDSANAQYRASLASIYHQLGDTDKAIEILVKASEDIKTFAPYSYLLYRKPRSRKCTRRRL